jgi:hypothetical protein
VQERFGAEAGSGRRVPLLLAAFLRAPALPQVGRLERRRGGGHSCGRKG